MRLSRLYTLVGLVLGALAGLAVAFQAFAVAAGVSWLFLFGDSPWPASAERFLLGIPLFTGLATLCAGGVLGYVVGRRAEASPRPERARRRGRGLLLGGLVLWLLVIVLALGQHQRELATRATAAASEAAYERLRDARHVITGLREVDAGAEEVRLTLGLEGRRSGAYQLSWRLEDPLYGITLQRGERRLTLDPASTTVTLTFDAAALAEQYRQTVLEGRNDKVLVDGAFRLRLSLVPVLDDAERQTMPAREIDNLERGLSPLVFETDFSVPVTLDLTAP